jgi:glycogen debranching enzyme
MPFDARRAATLKERSFEVLQKNRRVTNGHQYTVPSPQSYPYQWLWDSCFHAIALSHFDTEDAKAELRSLLSRQFENGMVPHMIYWEKGTAIDIKWGKEGTSSITQPPMIAQAALQIYEKDGDKAFLKDIFPSLYHFYNYLLSERDPRRHHLAGILNPDESGEDNSPRFDTGLGLPPQHTAKENFSHRLELVAKLQTCDFDAPFCMKNFFWIKDVPFNSIFVKNLRALAQIAEEIGYSEEALFFSEQALEVIRAMRDRMMEDGIFWSTNGDDYSKIRVKTWAMFTPLYAGILSREEAKKLVEGHLLNKAEFAAPFFVPSVSMDEKSYDPAGFWRGPVWLASNWFIFRGLLDYGLHAEAAQILESTARLLELSGFREQYHPETGEGQGAEAFSWGALIVDMLGYEPPKPEGGVLS